MKFSCSHFLILAASLLVATSVVHAQEACDPFFDIFCASTDNDVDSMIDEFLATIPDPVNNATSGANNGTTDNPKNATAANPVYTHLYRRDGCPAPPKCPGRRHKKGLVEDVAGYFKGYADNIKLIAHGKFGEGIFNQLKNAGSWCDNPNTFVKSVITGMNTATAGSAEKICGCIYATLKPYDNFDQFKLAVLCKGIDVLASDCPNQSRNSIANQLQGDLRPTDPITEAYKKKICDTLNKSTAGKSCT
ncbi:hypothetical protein DFQ27_009939 [Actinomortierella ambigua]|uniref:Secreted protein n=1 Tax=Actinomortierella ambigua TaxID=1343610 RepID=A0A9P6TWT5_9FUNG|nr:hypothetical protein DFQ27_009939 [Actinomortierella ambigua]